MTILRSLVFNVVFFAVGFFLTLWATALRLVAPGRVLGVAILWARTLVAAVRIICGIRLHVQGLEHIPPGAALIASRHQSAFDTFVWLTLVPRCCYVFKHELLRIPLFGPLITAAGMIAVDRTGGGATGWLTTTAPVSPGEVITIQFIIWDTGDANWDSSVLLDHFTWQPGTTTTGTTRPSQ